MISYNQVLKEIERQVQRARQTNQESTIREALAAVRSLAEVALSEDGGQAEKVVPRNIETIHVPPQVTQAMPVQSLSSLEATPIEEEDGANGKSLFDF